MVSTTVGRFWPLIEWKIRDLATGITLGENQVGEICIKGPCVTAGYVRNIEETEKAFEDGWLRTGDIATVDRDGVIRLRGRCKDIIIRGGENISPKEIEILQQFPLTGSGKIAKEALKKIAAEHTRFS